MSDEEQPVPEEPEEQPAEAYDQDMLNQVVNVSFFGNPVFENPTLGFRDRAGTTTSSVASATGLVRATDISTALARFVRPTEFAGGTTRLAKDRMLVLCGREGIGKRASALALLREVTDGTLYLLSPSITLAELARYDFEADCGYLVVDHAVDTGPKETDFDWRVVRDRVETRVSYLVVTRAVGLSEGAESFGHVAWLPPSAERVLRAHWQQEWSPEETEVLGEVLTTVDHVRDVVGLARQLTGGKSLEEALTHLDTRVRAEVAEWVDNATERHRIVEVATLAFTTGVDVRTYDEAMSWLTRALEQHVPEPEADDDEDKKSSLRSLHKSWLDNALIDLRHQQTDFGRRAVPAFAKPEYRVHVLAQLWKRMDVAFWDAMGDWLDALVLRPRYELPVADGLAALAAIALDEVMSILDRWAQGSRFAAGQRATVYTLYLMACDESLAPTALRIATGWITRGKPTHRWVGAMAFIGQLGVRYPHDARRRLWQVCVQSHTVDGNVELVFGELFANLVRTTESAHLVLNFLADKVDRFMYRQDCKPALRTVTARTALAVLESRDAGTRRLAVLAHLADFPRHTGLVARLLSAALIHRPLRLRAIKALRALLEELARNAENAGEQARALGEALRAKLPVNQHDALEQDFRFVAQRKNDKDIRSLVDAVLDALKGRVA